MLIRKSRSYNEEQKNEVEKLTNKGVTDGIIAKKLDLHLSVIASLTTKYWNNKMKLKHLTDEKSTVSR